MIDYLFGALKHFVGLGGVLLRLHCAKSPNSTALGWGLLVRFPHLSPFGGFQI